MTAEDFRTLGRLIYGSGWKDSLSNQYKISPRTVGRWASGRLTVPEWLAEEMANTAEQIVNNITKGHAK